MVIFQDGEESKVLQRSILVPILLGVFDTGLKMGANSKISKPRFDVMFFQIAEYHIKDKKNKENCTSFAWMQKKKKMNKT